MVRDREKSTLSGHFEFKKQSFKSKWASFDSLIIHAAIFTYLF